MKAWIYQPARKRRLLGVATPWSVGWYDADGKRRCKEIGSPEAAQKYAGKIEEQLASGTYRCNVNKRWKDFTAEYQERIASRLAPETQAAIKAAMAKFAELAQPGKVSRIRTQTIDQFTATRRASCGRRKGETISPATVNKELRCIKAALRVAQDWGYVVQLPKVRMIREPEKLPRYMTPEDFAAIYGACDGARFPRLGTRVRYASADWWRGLLIFAYSTGWRISECLALRRTDLDLDARRAITRAADNKGKRDESVPLCSALVDHLAGLVGFEPNVFPWYHHERTLWAEFARIQTAAEIHLECQREHEHTPACHLYGFHDLRRAFATLNAARLTEEQLKTLMRHKSYLTTRRYINFAAQRQTAADALYVHPVLTQGRVACSG